jgi:hypothetical protein
MADAAFLLENILAARNRRGVAAGQFFCGRFRRRRILRKNRSGNRQRRCPKN